MADVTSWGWYSSTTWPSFSSGNNNNGRNIGNNLSISPSTYTAIIWRDPNNSDSITDNDGGDGTTSGTDRVVIGGVAKRVHEVAVYGSSTIISKGVTYTVPLTVWIFTDGTYLIRPLDTNIPAGHHKKATTVRLGAWDGTEYGASIVSTRDAPFVCFADGTMIETDTGPRLVQDLAPGDLILTLDHGPQPLRWIGKSLTRGRGDSAPILIRKGALGNTADIRVSPQHRVLITGWRAELYAGCDQVLAAAQHLRNDHSILRAPCDWVTYYHLLFDQHEIIETSGLYSESFHPAAYAMDRLNPQQRARVHQLFPTLSQDVSTYGPTARPCLRAHEVRALAA